MTYRSNLIVIFLTTQLLTTAALCGEDEYKPAPNYVPTHNLSRFFAKIRSGQPVVVMGIGGSVTEGHSWAAMSMSG